MNRPLLILFFIAVSAQLFGQANPVADSFKMKLEQATTDADRVYYMGQLSLLVMSVDKNKSDEYIAKMQNVAELSRDRSLMIDVLITDARRHYNFSGRHDYVVIGLDRSKKALELAKASHLEEKEAWAYVFLALGERLQL
jgi:hypothetical protein